jgi:hypothetical protein
MRKSKTNEQKKYDINKVQKPWSVTANGKVLSRNVIYIGDRIPDFLTSWQDKVKHILKRPNDSIVDNKIRQKIKKTVIDELIRLNYKYEISSIKIKTTVTSIKNIRVRIKRIKDKGYAVIIDRRKSADIDRDTLKIRKYLEENGIIVEDELICPTYCVKSKGRNK